MWRFTWKSGVNLVKSRRFLCATYATEGKATATVAPTDPPVLGIGPSVETPTKPVSKSPTVIIPKFNDFTKILEPPTQEKLDVNVCSFDTIPGPHSLRLISKAWTYVPMLSAEFTAGALFQIMNLDFFREFCITNCIFVATHGQLVGKVRLVGGGSTWNDQKTNVGNLLSWGGNAKFFQKFFNVYGPVVRLHGPFGGDVILLSRPEHASIVFQSEGTQPVRACLDSVEKYRLEHRRLRQAGPFLMSGPEWEKIQKTLEKPLQTSVTQNFKAIDSICDQFTERIISIRNLQDEMPKTFKNEILKWCLECMFSVTLNRNFGFLDPTGLSATSDPGRILDGVNGATEAIRKCEYGFHVWKFVETPTWKALVKNCDTVDSILSKYVERAQISLREKRDLKSLTNLSLIENLLLREDVLVEDVLTVLLDMVLIGVNATTHSVSFLLYHLAKTPKCQKKLYDEILKQPKEITVDTLRKMPYLEACLKESMRLTPPIPILNRVLAKDAVIHKYFIPKGTYVLIAAHLASLREEYFEDAKKFNPDRWFSNEVGPLAQELQAFASMPFGHGPKSCQAKELAQIEIGLLIIKILKRFTVEYNYGEIVSSNSMLATPTKPLNFRFVNRV